jgi:hypothetical protein
MSSISSVSPAIHQPPVATPPPARAQTAPANDGDGDDAAPVAKPASGVGTKVDINA